MWMNSFADEASVNLISQLQLFELKIVLGSWQVVSEGVYLYKLPQVWLLA